MTLAAAPKTYFGHMGKRRTTLALLCDMRLITRPSGAAQPRRRAHWGQDEAFEILYRTGIHGGAVDRTGADVPDGAGAE